MKEILTELARPFPAKYVHTNPSGGGSYIKHHVIEQRLIQVFGRPPNFERVEVIFGDVDAIPPNPNGKSKRAKEGAPALKGVIVGVIGRLSVEVNDEKWIAEEAGDCEQPHNWTTDGQRLKDAMSDAYKRCAMRWGCGLHLWSQDEYFLHDVLSKDSSSGEARPPQPSPETSGEVSPEPSKAKSSKEEPSASVASPEPSEEVEAVASGEVKQTHEESGAAEASSGDIYGVIANAMADRNLHMKVLIGAGKVALEKSATPPEGIHKDNILELPEEVLEVVATNLKLRQGALA